MSFVVHRRYYALGVIIPWLHALVWARLSLLSITRLLLPPQLIIPPLPSAPVQVVGDDAVDAELLLHVDDLFLIVLLAVRKEEQPELLHPLNDAGVGDHACAVRDDTAQPTHGRPLRSVHQHARPRVFIAVPVVPCLAAASRADAARQLEDGVARLLHREKVARVRVERGENDLPVASKVENVLRPSSSV